jgi:small conductance mechanosensitive channel
VAGLGVGFAFQGVLKHHRGTVDHLYKAHRVGVHRASRRSRAGGDDRAFLDESDTARSIPGGYSQPQNRGEILHNYGTIRQLQLKVGVAYGANLDEVFTIAKEIVAANRYVLKEPAPLVGISELADSSVTLSIQPWVAVGDMVSARAELYQAIVERFRAGKIDIPFPHREVRLLGGS